ncbi:MAG: hypothetical protein ACKE5M_08795 [Methylophilaceae bacterium]
MRVKQQLIPAVLSTLFFTPGALADIHTNAGPQANAHAPIGVMGDHTHQKNEWMLSYRFMTMDMDGNRSGSSSISPEEIATTVPNRLAGQPMQPPTLRVVPTKMTMDMHMFGAMYAPTDNLTLMVMVNYIENDMDHITFQGMMGTNRLGTFTTTSRGWGDTKISGLVKIYDNHKHKVHLNLGISLPTGSITKKDTVLTPMNTRVELRLPYAMQLGSGTYDLLPGITYQTYQGKWNFGAQYMATIRTSENDEDYTLGDEHKFTGWASYSWLHNLSTSVRLAYMDIGNIDGADPKIAAPVQTADPNNYGEERLDLYAGINWAHHSGHRLALEVGAPVYQHLDGPQLETDWTLTAGYQYAF